MKEIWWDWNEVDEEKLSRVRQAVERFGGKVEVLVSPSSGDYYKGFYVPLEVHIFFSSDSSVERSCPFSIEDALRNEGFMVIGRYNRPGGRKEIYAHSVGVPFERALEHLTAVFERIWGAIPTSVLRVWGVDPLKF